MQPVRSAAARAGAALRFALAAVLGLALVAAGCASPPERRTDVEYETIDLVPDDRVGWSMRNVLAPITGLFLGGPGYWYTPREIWVDTTPPGGAVDLFYVRTGFQKRFEQGEAPVLLLLPARIDAGPRDSVTIRAFREGYRQQSVSVRMSSREDEVVIALDPLPNTLVALSHRYFAHRSSIAFLTEELLEFRVQDTDDGFSVVLNETARSAEAAASMAGTKSPIVSEVFGQQLGEDLVVQVVLTEESLGAIDVRSRSRFDAARELYEFSVDLVPADGGADAVQAAIGALARLRSSHVTGCALRFDATLHERLDRGSLDRALTPHGDFTDRYVRAAMRRLGEITPGGAVSFSDGSVYDPRVPIELEAALSQPGGAHGFLALLRSFVADLEAESFRRETLRSLVAPELDPQVFSVHLDEAEAAEDSCKG